MSASAGKVLLTPKGDFSTSATYSILDWVRYNGGVYVAKQTTTGNLPTDTTYWEKMIDSVSTLSGLSDVNITNIADGETLIWDATNSEWVNGTITGGGSYITLTTTTEQGENVSMSIGGATYTGTFSSEGICTFEGVKETGVATISTARVTTTLEIEYYGSYVAVVNYVPAHIYGVYWDGTSSPVLTRTDLAENFVDHVSAINNETGSSPFDDLYPWSDIKRVENSIGGTLVEIPKFYFKLDIDDTTGEFSLKIADKEVDGFTLSPAHRDRGDGKGIRDVVYVGAYACNSSYKSVTGQSCSFSSSFNDSSAAIRNLGSGFYMIDEAMLKTIQMLYLVEYANWDSESTIGNSVQTTTGLTDTMQYHTGSSSTKDAYQSYDQALARYRYIEGILGCRLTPEALMYWVAGTRNGNGYVNVGTEDFVNNVNTGINNFNINPNNTDYWLKRYKKASDPLLDWYFGAIEVTRDKSYVSNNFGPVGESYTYKMKIAGGYGLFGETYYSASSNYTIGKRLMYLP